MKFEKISKCEIAIINELGNQAGKIKYSCSGWVLWRLKKQFFLKQESVNLINEKLKELNNAEI